MLRGGLFVFSCCVMNYKCGCLKEHTAVWVERLSAPHSFRHLAQVWQVTPEAFMRGCTEAPSGCWQIHLLVVGLKFLFSYWLSLWASLLTLFQPFSTFATSVLATQQFTYSLQHNLLFSLLRMSFNSHSAVLGGTLQPLCCSDPILGEKLAFPVPCSNGPAAALHLRDVVQRSIMVWVLWTASYGCWELNFGSLQGSSVGSRGSSAGKNTGSFSKDWDLIPAPT